MTEPVAEPVTEPVTGLSAEQVVAPHGATAGAPHSSSEVPSGAAPAVETNASAATLLESAVAPVPRCVRRLHPMSWLFLSGKWARQLLPVALGLAVIGNSEGHWAVFVWVGLGAGLVSAVWGALHAWRYSYELSADELLVREGVLDRTQRHIPLARIQSVNQKRKLLHRLFGVCELHLESAAGGKPEAVMRVVSLRAAAELDDLLRHALVQRRPKPAATPAHTLLPASDAPPAPSPGTPQDNTVHPAPAGTAPQPVRVLHQLPWAEILRLGLISNRGMVLLSALVGLVMPKAELRQPLLHALAGPLNALRAQVQVHDRMFVVISAAAVVVLALVLLRLLSVALAFLKYHGFRLQLQGGKLTTEHGLSTLVRASARLQRLQSWVLTQTVLHRIFGRCHLAVSVAGTGKSDEHGLEPGSSFNELAPIATPAQAQQLLQICLPALQWDTLQWQALHPRTPWRRWLGQARWLLPVWGTALWGVQAALHLQVPIAWWVGLSAALVALTFGYAHAWMRFAAYAQFAQGNDEVLVFRSGVLRRRWVIVLASRLQTLRVHSSPLDRRFGMVQLQSSTQGGSHHARVLDIPCLAPQTALALRARIWAIQQGAAA